MDWPWSSLRFPHLRDPVAVETPIEWLQGIDQPLFDYELTMLRTYVNRQQPFGAEDWQELNGLEDFGQDIHVDSTMQ